MPGSDAPTVRGLDHVVLRVADLERSIAFYADVLGCLVERRVDDVGLVQLRAGTALIDLVPVDSPLGRKGGGAVASTGKNVDHFALSIETFDEDALRAHLHTHGVEAGTTARRYGASGFGPSLYLNDPDGNLVELKGPAEAEDTALDATRRAVLETLQEMDRGGLTEGTAGNVSARTADGRVVLSPTALSYSSMQESDLVVTDLDGNRLAGDRAPTTEIDLHLACLRRHEDVRAVVHSHAVHASMFAIAGRPIPCVLEEFEYYVGGDVLVAPYHRTGTTALGEAAADRLGDRAAVLLANHGLVVVGSSAAEALQLTKLVERAARIVQGALAFGPPAPLPDPIRREFSAAYLERRRETARARGADPTRREGTRGERD